MFKDDFIKYLFFLFVAIFLLYIFQPGFWSAHPGLARFFNPGYSAPAPKIAGDSSGTKIAPAPFGVGYARIAGVSLSLAGDRGELRLAAAGNAPGNIDVGGWRVKTALKDIILPATRIAPGGIFVISSETAPASGGAQSTYYLGQKFLGEHDTIYLYSKAGILADKYTY